MNLGMFDRSCPSLKSMALIDTKRFDMNLIRIMKDMLYLCIERMFGLKNGCRTLERICFRLAQMILAHSTEEVGDHLKERED
jgi:hypothetical protein